MHFSRNILSTALALAVLAGCSSDGTIVDIPDYVEQDPLTFSVGTSSTSVSRAASHELEQGFMVSTYKLYGSVQQKVMYRYEASYGKTTYHGSKWNTVGEAGAAPDYFYQTQYERYWDLSAFPYRFHAITPCPKTADNSNIIKGFELSDQKLTIPKLNSTIYQSQSSKDGVITPEYVPDPYLIAQVQRDADGKDWDLLQPVFNADGDLTSHKTQIVGSGSTERTRAVPLVFHHINSKVRFAIFADVDAFPAEPLTIKNVTITATNPDGPWGEFIYKVQGFISSLSGSDVSFFDNIDYGDTKTDDDPVVLLKNTSKTYDLRDAFDRAHAYFFDIPSTIVGYKDGGSTPVYDDIYNSSGIKTPGGLLQIPQKGVELYVEFDINNEHYSFQLEVNGNTKFDWRASCRYTYYIVVKHLVPFEIAFTATIEPWVTVTSSNIDTDLEQ